MAENFFLKSHRKPIIIAHRGASSRAPENTLAAFRAAIADKADAIELDVQRTRDGRLVIMHDPVLGRTNNGRGLVGRKTLRQLQTLDAGSHFHKDYAGETLPSLADVLDEFGKTTHYVVELKFYQRDKKGFARQVYEMVAQRGLLDRTIFLSFSPKILRTIKQRNPSVATCLALVQGLSFLGRRADLMANDVIAIAMPRARTRQLTRFNALGKPVNVWLGKSLKPDRLKDLRVSMITTNFPAETRRHLS